MGLAATTQEWSNRVIYQVFTDRFDKSQSDKNPCSDLNSYCGGTFKGVQNRLDYLIDLGIDAIWISPVVSNTANGYHGYWASNLYTINSHFGTAQDLKNLVNSAHSKGMLVMVDVVANHMGESMNDLPNLVPFNDTKFYHDCGCVDGDCCPSSCSVDDYSNLKQMEHCQLFGLPDLSQDISEVANTLKSWIKSLVSEYSFDGIRIDTIPFVKSAFWGAFTDASGVFNIGEVSNPDASFCANFVNPDALTSVFQYPLYYAVLSSFAFKASFQQLSAAIVTSASAFGPESTKTLGVFLENHDIQRFLYFRNDLQANKNAILFSVMTVGIPVIYYGQEQGYHGGASYENNREPLWTSGDILIS